MIHEERIELANEIARRALNKYGEAILAIAVYASVAKNEDREYSDLEMWIATTEDFPPRAKPFIYRDLSTQIK